MTLTTKTISVAEDSGQITLQFPWVGLGGGYVDFLTVDGSALKNFDYLAVPARVYIPPGSTTSNYPLTVSIVNDYIKEGTETFKVVSHNEGTGSDYHEYDYIVTITDNDTGILQPNGSILGPLKTNEESSLKKIAIDSIDNFASGMELAGESKYITNSTIPSFEINNVKYGFMKDLSEGRTVFNSLVDYKYVTDAAKTISLISNTYKAYQDVCKVLSAPNGSFLDAYKAASASFIIAMASGEVGSIVGGAVIGGLALAGAPALVGIGIGVAVGAVVAATVQDYSRDIAKQAGYLPKSATLAVQAVSGDFDGTNVVNSKLSLGAPAPTPTWEYNPTTHVFRWLTTPDPAKIAELRTVFGFEKEHPIDKTLVGDKDADVNDLLYGGSGSDQVSGVTGDDALFGQAGSDRIEGGDGRDIVDGGTGNDLLFGGLGNDQLDAGAGNDELNGDDGDDQLWGKDGDDKLQGGTGNDEMHGGAGNDVFVSLAGNDVADGGEGRDQVSFVTSAHGVQVTLGAGGSGYSGGDSYQFLSVEDAIGSPFDDQIDGDNGDNDIRAGVGNDILSGYRGTDALAGQDGDDKIYVDDLTSTDAIAGGTGRDAFYLRNNGGKSDDQIDVQGTTELTISIGGKEVVTQIEEAELYTGDGNDRIDASKTTVGLTLDAWTGDDTILGGSGNDLLTINGLGSKDHISGGAGFDRLQVYDSGNQPVDVYLFDDTSITAKFVASQAPFVDPTVIEGVEELALASGSGNDHLDAFDLKRAITLDAGTGKDVVYGGGGNDSLSLGDVNAGDMVLGGAGRDILTVRDFDGTAADHIVISGSRSLELRFGADANGAGGTLFGQDVENADLYLGGGNDIIDATQAGLAVTLRGGAGANELLGGAGNDNIDGGDGADTINGGAGEDTVWGGWGLDIVNAGDGNDKILGSLIPQDGDDLIDGGAGMDTLVWGTGNPQKLPKGDFYGAYLLVVDLGATEVRITYNLLGGSFLKATQQVRNVENAVGLDDFASTLIGDNWNNKLVAAGAGSTFLGFGGDDILVARAAGAHMEGGEGNDQYFVDGGATDIVEYVGEGIDTVLASIDFGLQAVDNDIEVLKANYTGSKGISLTGNLLSNTIVGGKLADTLDGRNGDDNLDGGTGNDLLRGGAGNDTYAVDSSGDIVDESSADSDGTDIVKSSVSFSLADAARANGAIENLTLTGSGAINATGNGAQNVLTGNSGVNNIDGGPDADTMRGLGGNDTYVVDNAGDIVDESVAGSGGMDTVLSSVAFSLTDPVHARGAIEKLILTGASNVALTGSSAGNTLTGNQGDNLLDGGLGSDSMAGGAGNDAYVVDNAADVVDESVAGSGGVDTVRSSVSFSLLDTAHAKGAIENLTLIGAAAANGTGNATANKLIGNAAANILVGNLGNDFLTGAAGDDTFLFDTKPNKTANVDHITDLVHLTDHIELDHTIFTKIKIGSGHLKNGAFFADAGAHKAHDSGDRIVYDTTSGGLYYDKDGKGGHHAKLFAILDGSPDNISASDFLIVA